MSPKWYCPYCGQDLPNERAAHCGEVGHAEPYDDEDEDEAHTEGMGPDDDSMDSR